MPIRFTFEGRTILLSFEDDAVTIGTEADVVISVPRLTIYDETLKRLFMVRTELLLQQVQFLTNAVPNLSGQDLSDAQDMIRAINKILDDRKKQGAR